MTYDGSITVSDFDSPEAARAYADDVASESDYEAIPPAAYIVDSDFNNVDRGIHYAVRKPGMTADEPSQAAGRTTPGPASAPRGSSLLDRFRTLFRRRG